MSSSRIGTAAESFRSSIVNALARSATGAFTRRWQDTWSGSALPERRAFIGIVLTVASVAHVILAVSAGHMVGPFWLIIPAVAACLGVLCIVAGGIRSAQR